MSWQTIKTFLAPPVFEGDEQKSRNAALINVIVLVTLAAATFGFFATFIEGETFQLNTTELDLCRRGHSLLWPCSGCCVLAGWLSLVSSCRSCCVSAFRFLYIPTKVSGMAL